MKHGSRATYLKGCRCEPCGDAHRTYVKTYKLRRYQQGKVRVPVEPILAHLETLMETMTISVIATHAGVSYRTLLNIIRRDHRTCWPSTANAVLAVKPGVAPPPQSNQLVNHVGAARRIQALQAIGWSRDRLARELDGYDTTDLHALVNGGRLHVTARMDLQIRDLYRRLWATPPPVSTSHDKAGVTRARRTAALRGWPPPMSWDDAALDDPNARPDLAEMPPSRKRVHLEDIEFLLEDRPAMTATQMAERFHCSPDAVIGACRRAGRADLVQRLARNAALLLGVA